MEGAGFIWRVSLKNEAGEVLRGDKYAVYGGFGAPWIDERSYVVTEQEDGTWQVRMHGAWACNGGRYQLMARCRESGVEWKLATGCVEIERRVGHCCGGAVDAEGCVVDCVLHHETLQAEVVLGDSTAACVAAAAAVSAAREDVLQMRHAVVDMKVRAVEAAGKAEGYAAAAQDAAADAEDAAEDAEDSAESASTSALAADVSVTEARTAAADAAAAAGTAVARAADAAASAKAAADAASDALEAEAAARASEAAAARSAEVAGGYDMRAFEYGQAAEVAAGRAEEAAAAAAAAQAEAEAASEAAAEHAELLGDAALQGQANVFTEQNTFSGSLSILGSVAMNGNAEEAAGWLALCSGAMRILLKSFTIADYQSIWKKMHVDFPEDVPMPSYSSTSGTYLFYNSKMKTAPAWVFETVTSGQHVFTNSLVEKLPNVFMFPNITKAWNIGAHGMFHNCKNLVEIPVAWTFDKLKYGSEFASGSKNLRRAHGLNLCHLTEGNNFMNGTQVDKITALRVLTTIPDRNTAELDFTGSTGMIVIGIHRDFKTDAEVLEAIAAAEWKGWQITVQWNGTAGEYATAGASAFAMREPVYAKRGVPYEDGTQSIDWGHYVTNAEENGYTEFATLAEAREALGVPEELPEEE